MWIIMTGTPITGFEFFGPFGSPDEAINWADKAFDDTEWWHVFVEAPPEVKGS